MRPSDESLTADYIADLECDVRCALRDGQHEYAAKCQAEIDALRSAASIRVSRYGVPSPR